MLPGDSRYGDSLSTAGRGQSQLIARRLAEATEQRPSLLREAGLSALQVWQSLTDLDGRSRGERELTIVFTDLVDFSNWALEAGDEAPWSCSATSARRSSRRCETSAARSSSASATG